MPEPSRKRFAVAMANGDLISVRSYSMYRLAHADPKAPEHILSPDVDDEVLGRAALSGLQNSRFLSLDESTQLRATEPERYRGWVEKLMRDFGYADRRALFKHMKNCTLELQDKVIIIKPTYHEKLEAWSGDGIDPADYIQLTGDAAAREVGAALRLAFQRCID